MAGLGLLVLRLTLASLFVAHGAHTLFGVWASPGIGPGGLSAEAARLSGVGLHPEYAIAVTLGVVQAAGGVLLGLGWFTRWVSIALFAVVGMLAWKEQLPWGFFLNWAGVQGRGHGLEYSLVLGAALIFMVLGGAGDWSVDGLRARSKATRAAGRARLRNSG